MARRELFHLALCKWLQVKKLIFYQCLIALSMILKQLFLYRR